MKYECLIKFFYPWLFCCDNSIWIFFVNSIKSSYSYSKKRTRFTQNSCKIKWSSNSLFFKLCQNYDYRSAAKHTCCNMLKNVIITTKHCKMSKLQNIVNAKFCAFQAFTGYQAGPKAHLFAWIWIPRYS